MADPEVATRAPENDAAEDAKKEAPPAVEGSFFAGDTPAQTGASLGVSSTSDILEIIANLLQEHCVTDRPTRKFCDQETEQHSADASQLSE